MEENRGYDPSSSREGMYGRGTSRGVSKDACRFEYDVVRWCRLGRGSSGREENQRQ